MNDALASPDAAFENGVAKVGHGRWGRLRLSAERHRKEFCANKNKAISTPLIRTKPSQARPKNHNTFNVLFCKGVILPPTGIHPNHDERPKPFKWTKTAEDILTRERRALDKLDDIRGTR
ncbi:hypothetical protein [Roseovarius sp.]|uniref:hypothetical protein n=1 Tax=Roseovarius sp. TaxID=1486281 RepID=UPI003566658B